MLRLLLLQNSCQYEMCTSVDQRQVYAVFMFDKVGPWHLNTARRTI